MTMAKAGSVNKGATYAPWPLYEYIGRLTIGTAGAVTVTFTGAATPNGTALFSCVHTGTGVYTLTGPTGSYGMVVPQIASDTIDDVRIGKGDFDPAAGTCVIETRSDDGTSGVPALADPASGDVIYVRWSIFDSN